MWRKVSRKRGLRRRLLRLGSSGRLRRCGRGGCCRRRSRFANSLRRWPRPLVMPRLRRIHDHDARVNGNGIVDFFRRQWSGRRGDHHHRLRRRLCRNDRLGSGLSCRGSRLRRDGRPRCLRRLFVGHPGEMRNHTSAARAQHRPVGLEARSRQWRRGQGSDETGGGQRLFGLYGRGSRVNFSSVRRPARERAVCDQIQPRHATGLPLFARRQRAPSSQIPAVQPIHLAEEQLRRAREQVQARSRPYSQYTSPGSKSVSVPGTQNQPVPVSCIQRP